MSFMNKAEVINAFTGLRSISKRAIQTLGSILKYSCLQTMVRPAAEQAEGAQLIASAGFDRYPDPETGAMRFVDQGAFNKMMYEIGQTPAVVGDQPFADPGMRITMADLPKLPDFSDDPIKNEKAVKAREDLANEIALLGKLFTHDAPTQ